MIYLCFYFFSPDKSFSIGKTSFLTPLTTTLGKRFTQFHTWKENLLWKMFYFSLSKKCFYFFPWKKFFQAEKKNFQEKKKVKLK